MILRQYKSIIPSFRQKKIFVTDGAFTQKKAERAFLIKKHKYCGRNNLGRITSPSKGGAYKRQYRIINFITKINFCTGLIKEIEYDPNRYSYIALIESSKGTLIYCTKAKYHQIGDIIQIKSSTFNKLNGSIYSLNLIPLGLKLYNIELKPKKGPQLARSAGTYAIFISKTGKTALICLPSTELRLFPLNVFASLGKVGNSEHKLLKYGKAGSKRWIGIRPHVRGVVKNPIDHPHGGGEGKSPVGRKSPVTAWGQIAFGLKTRSKNKYSNPFVFQRRTGNKSLTEF